MEVPPRTLVAGVPARVKRELKPEELARMERGWRAYVEYKDEYLRS
jgi:phenylacetic acid degradation protein